YLKLRGQSLERSMLGSAELEATNRVPATNQFLEVRCENYEIRTNTAYFTNQVQVVEVEGDQKRGHMSCGTLTATLSNTNQLQRLIALDNVLIEQGDQQFQAGQAVYDATNSTLALTQNPTWSAGPRSGGGQRISLIRGEQM